MKRALLILRRAALGVIAVALLAGALFTFPAFFLEANRPAPKADVIVVLGGETPQRAACAAELYRQGVAPRILVSGAGDAPLIRRALIQGGVPAAAITLEEDSASTWENAVFSVRVLRGWRARRVVVVTTWYHTRRAVACFRSLGPELTFSAASAEETWLRYSDTRKRRMAALFGEYAKLVWYLPRYGIWPF